MGGFEPPKIKVNNGIPIWRYLHSVRVHLSTAQKYRAYGNAVEEYALLFKVASIIIEALPGHADLQTPAGQEKYGAKIEEYRDYARTIIVPRCEALKPVLQQKQRLQRPARPHTAQIQASNLPGMDWSRAQPDLATPRNMPQHYKEGNETVERALSAVAASRSEPDAADPFAASAAYSMIAAPSPNEAAPQAEINGFAIAQMPAWASAMPSRAASHAYVSKHSLFGSDQQAPAHTVFAQPCQPMYPHVQVPESGSLDLLNIAPPRSLALPPQELEVEKQVVREVPPLIPGATCNHEHAALEAVSAGAKGPEPVPMATEVRNVYMSPALLEEFLRYARHNTKQGIEFCGVLAGELSAKESSFTITNLIIPKQRGEANVVEMLNEEELFEYQFERGLLPLGWIHTHPTQTCFLSSIDVHTQCGFQVMLPEAIAIVMAPTDPRSKCGIFRLTTPGGMSVVQNCRQKGFHMHPTPDTGQEIYELCGHVFLDESASATFDAIDLR